jgi:CRP/FNR family transcriptional regulator, cyclic AMP receptor protein
MSRPVTLDREDRLALIRQGHSRGFRRRQVIYRQGDPAAEVYLVERGIVKRGRTIRGRAVTLDFLGAGSLFGAWDLSDETETTDSAVAVTPTQLLVLARAEYEELVRRRPALAAAVTRMLGRRVRAYDRRIGDLVNKPVAARLTDLLEDLARRFGQATGDGVALAAALTHEDLGSYIGSTRETVTMTLGELARSAAIERRGRCIILRRGRGGPAARTETGNGSGEGADAHREPIGSVVG